MNAFYFSLAIGFFIAMVVWQIYVVFRDVPSDDRQFMDSPALGFRLVWPLIKLAAHYGGGFISETQLQIVSMKLKQGGVEFAISATQFIASKYVAAIVAFGLMLLVGFSLERNLIGFALIVAIAAFFYPELWLKEASGARRAEILRTLPFYLDIVTLSVEAGSNLTGGMTQAVQKSADSPLRREFSRVLRDIRAGRTRADALRDMSDRTGSLSVQNVVGGLIQAERTGSSLGALLRAQSEQLRTERFQRAEKLAMEAPVKLLGPLVMFIFPNTFLVLIFLLLSKAIQQGALNWAPLVWLYGWPG